MTNGSMRKQTLWRCPKCGHRFATKNMAHSCGRYRVADHFKGRPTRLRRAFERFVRRAKACGPATVYAQKTRIVIQHRVRFAGVTVRADWLDTHLWLRRTVEHPLIHRIEPLGKLGFAVHFRLCSPDDVDPGLTKLLREAYDSTRHRIGQVK